MPARRRLAAYLAAAAALCGLVELIGGWFLGIRWLRGFGVEGHPIWPWTSVGYIALSLGYLAGLLGHKRLARRIWIAPLVIAGASIAQILGGFSLGTDTWLFADALREYPLDAAGRPTLNSAASILLLTCAGYVSVSGKLRGADRFLLGEHANLLASASLGLGILAALLAIFSSLSQQSSGLFTGALPAGIMAVLLSTACIVWNVDFGRHRLLSRRHVDWRAIAGLLPVVLFFPVVPSLLEVALTDADLMSPLAREMIVVFGNIAIVAVVTYWAVVRLAHEQALLTDFNEALEFTTIVLVTEDGRISHWSRGCEQLYGWSAAEARGKRKYELLRSRCEQDWQTGLPRPAGPDVQQLVEQRRDGSEVTVLERTRRVERPGREPLVICNISDVSCEAEAMAALRASEDRLAIAMSAHELGIFEWDVQTGAITWSPGTEQRLGLAPNAIGDFESWRAQVEPEDVQQILDTIARAVADRAERFTFRYRFLQQSGTVRAVEGSSRAFYDAQDNLVRTVGVIMDVSEREEREMALRAREAQLRSVLETVPDGMVVVDERGKIREFSAAAEALWGYRAGDVVGRDYTLLIPQDQRERVMTSLGEFLRAGDSDLVSRAATAVGEHADGRRFPLEGRGGVTRVDGGVLFTFFFRDISERLAAEERLSDLNAELAHVSRQSAMSELAADISHELNQPLSATANFLSAARILIEQQGDADRISELLRMANEQIQRAGEIIRRMRAFMSKGEVEIGAESLEQTLRDAAELVLVGTGQFDIDVTYSLDPAARLIFADRIQIQQVLVNLLRNAIDVLRNSPTSERSIHIASRKLNEQFIEVSVSDTGPGIKDTVLKQLYTRFVTTKQNAGMGIGLSISRRIIEAHGGTLEAENRPEGGATFRFTVPAVRELEEA